MGDEEENSCLGEEGVFVIEQWKEILDRFDEEGFGEIPVEALEKALTVSVGSDQEEKGDSAAAADMMLDAPDDPVSGDRRLALQAKLEVLRRQRRDRIDCQELVEVVSRKRSYSFRRAVADSKPGSRHEVLIRAKRRKRQRVRMKLLGLLRGRREEDQKDDENAVPTADSSSASKAPASASRCSSSIPLFFVLVGGTQLFFSLTHELMRDWKGRQLLPCHDAEPWRYLLTSLIPSDLWDFAFCFLSHLVCLLPLEIFHGTGRTTFIYSSGVTASAVLATLVDCRSSVLGGNGGTISAATALLLHRLLSGGRWADLNGDGGGGGGAGADERGAGARRKGVSFSAVVIIFYLSVEVGFSVHRWLSSSWPVCHCHLFGGAAAALLFSQALLAASPSTPLRRNRLFLSAFVVFVFLSAVLLAAAAIVQKPNRCIFFRKIQVNL